MTRQSEHDWAAKYESMYDWVEKYDMVKYAWLGGEMWQTLEG